MGKMRGKEKIPAPEAQPSTLQRLLLALTGLLFFLLLCLSSAGTVKYAGLFCVLGALAAAFLCFGKLRDRISLPLLALALYVLMDALSTAYATAGKFALYEFLKVLIAFCSAVILLSAAPGRGKRPGIWIASVLEIAAALASLVSMDLLSTHVLSGAFQKLMEHFTSDYAGLSGVEAGVRMTSVFLNPNVFAGVAGIGVLLSLGLCVAVPDGIEHSVHTALLYINSLGFLLAFSMGASGSIALAFVVMLLLEGREKRPALLSLMLETLAIAVMAAALVSATSFQAWSGVQPVPLLCAVLGAAALCALDRFAGVRLRRAFSNAPARRMALFAGGAAVVLAAFIVAAWTWTGPAHLDAGASLRRAAYPEPGTYTLTVETDGQLDVTIESQNRQETMMHTSTLLYSGPADGADFAVPEGSLVVYFNFRAPDGAAVSAAVFDGGGGSGSIPLGYRLLPGFMANRLQGLWANENAIQRFVFFDDGMKLFRRSPLAGLGLGAYENGIKSVQSFFYETKYAHNHYIQALLDTGIIGLALFLLLLGVSALAVWKGRDLHPLAPALGAALVFMAVHAFTEVVFSTYCYIPMAFCVFALIGLCCGGALPRPRLSAGARVISVAAICLFNVIWGALISGNLYARSIVSADVTLDKLVAAERADKFEWADFALSYVVAAKGPVPDPIRQQADAYALRLARLDSNAIPINLAEYYFATGRVEEALAMLEKYVDFVASDPNCWRNAFALLSQNVEDTELFRAGVLRISDMLDAWNAENMGQIDPGGSARTLIAWARG
ncbi:MAG: O-antigen ligase family protein [Oscillospiraceae bacterium]|nr:O-antigen ligase family protein [Oscillospiraceae bacterium]